MANRNRTTVRGPNAPSHEESQIWAENVNLLKQLPDLISKSQKVASEVNKHQRLLVALSSSEAPSADLLGKLEELYKEGIRLEEQKHSIGEKVKEQLGILSALKQASEPYSEPKRKRKDAPTDAQPAKTKKARTDEIRVGSEVAYHLPKAKQSEAEWIQCNVIRITGEYPKLRYEVQDPEPDEHGNISQTYKANTSSLILIPEDSTGLPPLAPGTVVLARYPETTTFYRAEVITTKRDGTCKLRFEGEEEIGKETDVERRLVLEV